jgi:hypothetical protein
MTANLGIRAWVSSWRCLWPGILDHPPFSFVGPRHTHSISHVDLAGSATQNTRCCLEQSPARLHTRTDPPLTHLTPFLAPPLGHATATDDSSFARGWRKRDRV